MYVEPFAVDVPLASDEFFKSDELTTTGNCQVASWRLGKAPKPSSIERRKIDSNIRRMNPAYRQSEYYGPTKVNCLIYSSVRRNKVSA